MADVRIETQVYVLVDGERKVIEHIAPDGTSRPLRVDVDLVQCDVCGALALPPENGGRHADYHRAAGADA